MLFREFIAQLSPAQVEALAEIMFLAADADGEVSESERRALAANVARVTENQVDKAQAEALIEQAATALASSTRAARLDAVKEALPVEQRNHALMLAIQVANADGMLRTTERELILEIAEALDIPGDTAADLVLAVTSAPA
jgi:uncharacterized tellurite resistance protein B-like protein